MSELAMTPVLVSVSAANAGALNTAVTAAVTAAKLVSGYVPNSVEIGSDVTIASGDAQVYLLVSSVRYKVIVQP